MTNKLPPDLAKHYTQKTIFPRPGEQPPRKGVETNSHPGQLGAARDWKMLADFDQQLIFPPDIATTNLSVHCSTDRVNSAMEGCGR